MVRERFPISSDLLELLLAFESNPSLSALAERMGRDPSVISRNLQRLAEDWPVLVKQQGRWHITPLGRQVCSSTRDYLERVLKTLPEPGGKPSKEPYLSDRALLMVINAQAGLLDSTLGRRCNVDAEEKIHRLLSQWRAKKRPILHVKHVSDHPESKFYRNSKGVEFISSLSPLSAETVIEKSKAGAFSETNLLEVLQRQGVETLVITGFTANECIDSTARQASELGFNSYVVGDATATFDLSGPDGKVLPADRVHRLVLANLNALFAKVIETKDLL